MRLLLAAIMTACSNSDITIRKDTKQQQQQQHIFNGAVEIQLHL